MDIISVFLKGLLGKIFDIIAFLYKRIPFNFYGNNLDKYFNEMESIDFKQYQKDYLNNIRKKKLWKKCCFYNANTPNQEKIAIALVNADRENIIDISDITAISRYFEIKDEKIIGLNLFDKHEKISCILWYFFIAIIAILNFSVIFEIKNTLISLIVIFFTMVGIAACLVIPSITFKRSRIFKTIIKDESFISRINTELERINNENYSDAKSG